jgi:hypothetical protein
MTDYETIEGIRRLVAGYHIEAAQIERSEKK